MPGSFVPVRAPSTSVAPPSDPPPHAGPAGLHDPAAAPPPIGAPRRLPELGSLAPFAEDPAVTDLLLDAGGVLWRDAGDGVRRAEGVAPLEPLEARRLAVALIAAGGRHLDDATPCVDVRVPGARIHAVLPPVSTGGPLLSIRIARDEPWRLDGLRAAGTLDAEQEAVLRRVVHDRRNVLVCGPAGTGKTSLLAALLAEVPHTERVVVVEDVAELQVDHPHVVGLEARQSNSDGAGGIAMAALVRETLRMRPDRLVVGECRGAEVAELLMALNTGHDGGAGTVHCSDPEGLGARLEALGALGGLSPRALRVQAAAAIDVVVQLGRREGRRSVDRIGRLVLHGGALRVVDL